jgi:hypothetical protein
MTTAALPVTVVPVYIAAREVRSRLLGGTGK